MKYVNTSKLLEVNAAQEARLAAIASTTNPYMHSKPKTSEVNILLQLKKPFMSHSSENAAVSTQGNT